MHANNRLAVEVTSALLRNAQALADDARLLFEHERFARSLALATLAGEELGKVAICLDWLFGDIPMSPKETRQAWLSHNEKIASLIAYRAAFIQDSAAFQPEELRADATRVARRKMDALYVDIDEEGRIRTPAEVSRVEAREFLADVEAAVKHATQHLGSLTQQVAEAIEQLAPHLLGPLSAHIDSLVPEEVIEALRRLLARAQSLTDEQWSEAVRENQVADLVGLLLGACKQ